MNYDEALAYWFAHANFEQRTPTADELKLDRMRAILTRLGDPHRRLRIVHVAGSKGKGSTSAMLGAILQRAGYRVGLFTSPHLCSHEERFQIDGQAVSSQEMAVLFTDVRSVIERWPLAGGPPTFFELATAVGLLHFERRRTSAVILEVGLGGRLDSTNVCDPVLAVITSISHDHTRILGDTLSAIAREKAGIIKPRRPVVSGVTVPEARVVIEEVSKLRRAPLTQLDADFQFTYQPGKVSEEAIIRPRVGVRTRQRAWPEMEVNLFGSHQGTNAAVVVASIEQLRRQGWHIPDSAVVRGLREVDWPARFEVVGRRPWVVLDCAHNVASMQALVETIQKAFSEANLSRRLLVFAASNDKDVEGMLRVLGPAFDAAFMTRYTAGQRAMEPVALAQMWESASAGPVKAFDSPLEALAAAQATAEVGDLVCVAGSVFLAGELRPVLMR